MSISVVCPQCGKAYDIPDNRAGQTGKCACGATMTIPSPESPIESPSGQDCYGFQGAVGPPNYATITRCPTALSVMIIIVDIVSVIWLLGGTCLIVAMVMSPNSSQAPPELGFFRMLIMLGLPLSIFILITSYFLLIGRNWARITMDILMFLCIAAILLLLIAGGVLMIVISGPLLLLPVLFIVILNMKETQEYCCK